MEASVGPLLPLFERERIAGRALVLGILVHTAGSTYRKAGALIAIAADDDYAGLISGGCLEGDLRERAQTVLETGAAQVVCYNLRGEDELFWGLGLGCEGAMHILLLRCGPSNSWQPLAHLAAALAAHSTTAVGVVVESSTATPAVGSFVLPPAAHVPVADPALAAAAVPATLARAIAERRSCWLDRPTWRLLALPLALPPRVLLLGAGPDAVPVVELAARLGWKVTLVDHRPAYAVAAHFPAAERVVLARPEELAAALELRGFTAAVVMSHHLLSDLAYLRALAATAIPYIGLLGPTSRREKLLADLGPEAAALMPRLHGPVGLPLGGRRPESIALAIVAQLHAFVHCGPDGAALAEAASAQLASLET